MEVASGQPFDEFLRRRIFEPLGMERHLLRRAREAGATAWPRSTAGPGTGWRRSRRSIRFPETYSSGAGGLSSTAADYFRFAQMLADGGQLDGKRLLSPRGWS